MCLTTKIFVFNHIRENSHAMLLRTCLVLDVLNFILVSNKAIRVLGTWLCYSDFLVIELL